MMRTLVLSLLGWVLCVAGAAPDAGPTYGKDYSGSDTNVTRWNSPSNMSANHWELAALMCDLLCEEDVSCFSWTYCTPEGGSNDPERCCLKYSVPAELSAATHWTGLSTRGVKCATENNCPGAPTYDVPHIHYSPPCVRAHGWHDIAGALTWKGVHHVFQGCPDSTPKGWHHASSTDLVHWVDHGIGPEAIQEPWGNSSPCSGFVTVDDSGTPCSGFRQCGSDHGMNHPWDVPLELRCATDENITNWSDPIYIFDVFFNRALPYDPVRPWKDSDGMWYATIAMDACNTTKRDCPAGSSDVLWRSPKLHGDGAKWEKVGNLFVSNATVLQHGPDGGGRYCEFVTPEYFGSVPGDPKGGATRVFTDNGFGGYTMYFVGTQEVGKAFIPDYNKTGAFDWSSFTATAGDAKGLDGLQQNQGMNYGMARTLGSDPNQVTVTGRRVQVAWLAMGDQTSMSLPRDITLDAEGNLCQQFVPELQMLRVPGSKGLQMEVVATFSLWDTPKSNFGVRVLDNGAGKYVEVGIDPVREHVYVDGSRLGGGTPRAGPLWKIAGMPADEHYIHIIVDHPFVVMIANNRTAIYNQVKPTIDNVGINAFGTGTAVKASLETWALLDANKW